MSTYSAPTVSEILRLLFKNLKSLLITTFVIAVIIAGISLLLPNKYKSSANLLPSQRPSLGLDLFSESGGLSSIASNVLGQGNDESDRYLVLLNSYSTLERVVRKFDLTTVYEVNESDDPISDAIEELKEHSTFENREEGNFVIAVLDEDPTRAKQMADYYVEILNDLNTSIVASDARQYREFLEQRYATFETKSDSLQNEFIAFQKEYGVFELPEQVQEYFTIIGSVTTQQIQKELELKLLSTSVNKESEVYQNKLAEYNILSEKLDELYRDTDPRNLLLNFDNIASVGSDYYRLMFEIEIQAEIQKFLLPLYEQAKMEEAKALPIVTVIDAPQVPKRKAEPRRSIIVILGAISAFILLCLYYITRYTYTKNEAYFDSIFK
jgi:uncharacterized protein involved in exopolysaccharide biosynthesis